MLQEHYTCESLRGRAGLGNFELTNKYIQFHIPIEELVLPNAYCSPSDIVKSVRDHDFLAATDPATTTSNTKFTRAWQIIKADAVSFSSRLGVYTVQGYNGVHSVKLNPLSCSCGLKGDQCVHKLSVLLANCFDVQADKAYEEMNLNALSKKGKGKGEKSGRKNPRRCDVDAIAASDSAAAKQIPSESDPPPVKKIRPQTQTPESETPSKDPPPLQFRRHRHTGLILANSHSQYCSTIRRQGLHRPTQMDMWSDHRCITGNH